MKKILFLILTVVISCSAFGQNFSKIEKELQDEMQLRSSEDLIRVNIIMKAQYDQYELRAKAMAYKSKEDKRSFVIDELKRHSKETQSGVEEYLNYFSLSGNVAEIQSFWIYNGVNCYATKNVIEEIASLDEVLIVAYDIERNMLPDDENPREAKDGGSREITYNVTKVGANQVWNELGLTGEGIVVAVIDTGVNYNHNDINSHMWEDPAYPYHGYNFVANNNNPMDDHSHGTHCAGTVAGDGTSGSQTGMAPDAKIMAIKVLNSSGNGSVGNICAGIQFAVEHGAHLFSLSVGFYGGGTVAERIQFRNTMINSLEVGIVGAVAAGNEGTSVGTLVNVRVPGNCPPPWLHPDQTITGGITCVVSIGATNQNDGAASFTSRGPVSWQDVTGFNDYPYNPGIGLIRPDVCAPGVDIKSLRHNNNTGYTLMDGTSMATPCVAGVMALMMQKNPALTPAEICEILETTATPLSATKSNTFGSGRINAYEAVMAVETCPVSIYEIVVDDSQGNNNGNMNPGETIRLNVSLINDFNEPANNAVIVISTDSEYITLIDNSEDFGSFSSGEIKTINNAFSFSISSDAPAKTNIVFNAEIFCDGESKDETFDIITFDYELSFAYFVINDGGDGILSPGETSDMDVTIINSGNEPVVGLTGILSSYNSMMTINSNTDSFGDLLPDETAAGTFNVTLSDAANPNDINIPFFLQLTDENDRGSFINFSYIGKCAIVFELHDSSGNGWNGNAIKVNYSDATPSAAYTILSGGYATFSVVVNSGITVSLSWQTGGYVDECSFEIHYENGDEIYSASGHPGTGTFFSWVNNCPGEVLVCDHPKNLSGVLDDNNMIDLSWNAPSNGTPVSYDVFRGNTHVGNTTNTYYSLQAIAGVNNIYVVAIYSDACVSAPAFVCVNIEFICDAISDIIYEITYNKTVIASWTAPADDSNLTGYNIYIDGVLVETITQTIYTFEHQVGLCDFCVEAVHTADGLICFADKVCEQIQIYESINLVATATSNVEIELVWQFDYNDVTYSVYRADELIASELTDKQYVDNALAAESEYCYTVKSYKNQLVTSASNVACATTLKGINNFESNLKVYPNPSNSIVNIEGENIEKIVISNSLGQIIGSLTVGGNTQTTIDVSQYSSGTYVFRVVFADNSAESIKVVVKK